MSLTAFDNHGHADAEHEEWAFLEIFAACGLIFLAGLAAMAVVGFAVVYAVIPLLKVVPLGLLGYLYVVGMALAFLEGLRRLLR